MKYVAVALSAIALVPTWAAASVSYEFDSPRTFPFSNRPSLALKFGLSANDFIAPGATDVQFAAPLLNSCVVSSPEFACESVSFSRTVAAEGRDVVLFSVRDLTGQGRFTTYGYYFELGAFTNAGVHLTVANNDVQPGTLTVAVFADTSAPAPEPSSWAMMLSGFGLIGGAMRYRRNRSVSLS